MRGVVRTLGVLRALNEHNGARVSDLAVNTHIPRPSLYRILETLRDLGYVRRNPDGERYEVRINLREQGTNQWFEREFIWHVDLVRKRVNAASLPADGLMPEGPDSPQVSGGRQPSPRT